MDANLMDYNNMIDTLLLMKKEYIKLFMAKLYFFIQIFFD